ncbi:Short-chain dehydrogenase/reductase family protein [Mycena venus]|uniref:Short-chain dehydrogenase/reductase family protein n=1 Tax=Mycena venus TaxID=2733690 RepID=A0A8H6WRM4_9AGAR|nr:Short-chain dehydrogenase/reductase family protein [Mycena venus]
MPCGLWQTGRVGLWQTGRVTFGEDVTSSGSGIDGIQDGAGSCQMPIVFHPSLATTSTNFNTKKMGSILARVSPPSFRPERDIPDLSGKIILVTGGNTGIGYETVKQLLLKNAKVYLAARSQEKAAAAIKRLEHETKKTAIFLQLDLADLPSVRRAAETFLAQEERLDILFNNGGVMICPPEQLTAQNHDLQFGTNVIGHFFLTELLLPALTKSYEEIKVPARIINTSSSGHAFAPGNGMDFVSLKGGPERDAWVQSKGSFRGPWALYGESKIGNIFVSNYFAKAHSDVLVSCALHPGGIKTDLQRHSAGWMQILSNALLYPAPMGALTQLWAATVATPAQITAQYLVPWGKVGKADKRTLNTKLEDEVIAYIREQIKGF